MMLSTAELKMVIKAFSAEVKRRKLSALSALRAQKLKA
jgi:hypothetical protein